MVKTSSHISLMDVNDLSQCLEKLGNPTRLRIFRLLVRAGPDGLPVGHIQRNLGIPASTLSHHLFHLVAAGLLKQDREGRVLRCRANFDRMNDVVESLTAECCVDADTDRVI